jgi:folate-binding protein YgfZ
MSSRALIRTGIAPLPVLGLLKVHGAEATAFLQGQLTNDITGLVPGEAGLAGYCSVKGRLVASFWIWRDATEPPVYWLACSRDIAAAVAKRLGMFVLRAKVRVEDASDTWALLGAVAADGDALPLVDDVGATADAVPPAMLPEVVIEPAQAAALERAGVIPAPALAASQGISRGLVAVPAERLDEVLARAGSAAMEHADWLRLEVLSGVPRIDAGNQDLFVPQMVNFELVGGVGFRKGCYPGQEVVARTQYLGKLKRRMYLAVGEGPAPASGVDVTLDSAGAAAEPVGQVVLAVGLPGEDRHLVLFEARIDAVGVPWEAAGEEMSGTPALRTGAGALALLPLPYAIPAPTPATRPQR